MATKKKLRSLIHESWSYLITKYHDSEPALIPVSAKTLQGMLKGVEAEAKSSDRYPDGLQYSLEEINYILQRTIELDAEGRFRDNEDASIFGHALRFRFERFLKLLNEMDAELR